MGIYSYTFDFDTFENDTLENDTFENGTFESVWVDAQGQSHFAITILF